jgi:capsular polysaccharide biosynthesis protein
VNDGDQTSALPVNQIDDVPEHLWNLGDYTTDEERATADIAGLVSLGFIRAALRRRARLWCIIAVVGLLAGFGAFVKFHPGYQASTSIFLEARPGEDAGLSILDDQAMAQSSTMAGLAVRQFGLPQSASSFLANFTVTVATDQVLLITVTAPSSSEAVHRASVLATEFLQFRATQQEKQQKLVIQGIDQQLSLAGQHIKLLTKRINQLPAPSGNGAREAVLGNLRAERSQAIARLAALKGIVNSNVAATRVGTETFVRGSQVLVAASPLPQRSAKKRLIEYAGTGLILGLVIGMGIVIFSALTSERLRRRDDIASALGAPVKLSVGKIRRNRWRSGPRALVRGQGAAVRQIVVYLGSAVTDISRSRVALAVIPVDDPQVAALSLVSLAVSCAHRGMKVIVADLCSGSPAASLLGARKPGLSAVTVDDTSLIVVIPERDDVAPLGPIVRGPAEGQGTSRSEALVAAYASADLLLTLGTVNPALSAEHLATWAADAVVTVTAGQSSAERIHATGELIRLAGISLISGVLVGADKGDDSLGLTYPSSPSAPAGLGLGVPGQ